MLQYRAIARRIAREQSGPVLDWGTGFGQVAKLLADEGVDVTPFEYRPDRSARELLERQGFEVGELRRAHMLPLVLGGPGRLVWELSSALEHVPGLNVLATTIEGVAVA
jgi:hypothetical protein